MEEEVEALTWAFLGGSRSLSESRSTDWGLFGGSGWGSSSKGTAFTSASCLHFNVSILRVSIKKLCYLFEILKKKIWAEFKAVLKIILLNPVNIFHPITCHFIKNCQEGEG